jgi:hypothetical protein
MIVLLWEAHEPKIDKHLSMKFAEKTIHIGTINQRVVGPTFLFLMNKYNLNLGFLLGSFSALR